MGCEMEEGSKDTWQVYSFSQRNTNMPCTLDANLIALQLNSAGFGWPCYLFSKKPLGFWVRSEQEVLCATTDSAPSRRASAQHQAWEEHASICLEVTVKVP